MKGSSNKLYFPQPIPMARIVFTFKYHDKYLLSGCYWNRYETSEPEAGVMAVCRDSDLANNHKALQNLCIAIIGAKKAVNNAQRETNKI